MHDENRYNWNIFDIRTRWTDGVGTDLNQIRLKTDCQKEEHLEDRERQTETTKDQKTETNGESFEVNGRRPKDNDLTRPDLEKQGQVYRSDKR